VNEEAGAAGGGGTSRNLGLDQFVDSIGGRRLVVQNARWRRSRLYRLLRPYTLASEIGRADADVWIFRYAGFPFFWSLEDERCLRCSRLFIRLARRHWRGQRIILDVMDLMRHQSPNPAIVVKLDDQRFGEFERELFGFATEIWAASRGIGEHLRETYDLPPEKIKTVLNGTFPPGGGGEHPFAPPPGSFCAFYGGDLGPGWRGIEAMIESFRRCPSPSLRLVLCGVDGEWIPEYAGGDPRVLYLGSLSADQATTVATRCQVGIICQPPVGYFNENFPTKLGSYVALGLPTLCTPAKEAAEFVTAHDIGVMYGGNLGDALDRLARSPESLERFRRNLAGLRDRFTWSRIYADAFGLK
jgi:hypothetical protein